MSYRFFGEVINNEVTLSADDVFHLTKVLRIKEHEEIEVIANGKLFTCKVASFNPFKLKVHKEEVPQNELDNKLILIYVIPKKDKLDLVLQKAVELGVTKIVLTTSRNSVIKLKDGRAENKTDRYQKIIKGAAMQAKRDFIPEFVIINEFKEALKLGHGTKLIASEHERENTFNDRFMHKSDTTILIGSEGGFQEEEVLLAEKEGYLPLTFGPHIFRTETSVIYALSIINNFLRGKR